MNNLNQLYQQLILDHNQHPRNFCELEQCTHKAVGHNRLCGDELHIFLQVNQQHIVETACFTGVSCAICKASASLMTEAVSGKTTTQFYQLFERFHRAVMTTIPLTDEEQTLLGKLTALIGVRNFPVRIKCATLAWHTLAAALKSSPQIITTEV